MSLLYSNKDVNLLLNLLNNKYNSNLHSNYYSIIYDLFFSKNVYKEFLIYHSNIDCPKELYGEGKYFVIFQEGSYYKFGIYTQHMKNFIFKLPLHEVCLFINTPFVQKIAEWRLIIGK